MLKARSSGHPFHISPAIVPETAGGNVKNCNRLQFCISVGTVPLRVVPVKASVRRSCSNPKVVGIVPETLPWLIIIKLRRAVRSPICGAIVPIGVSRTPMTTAMLKTRPAAPEWSQAKCAKSVWSTQGSFSRSHRDEKLPSPSPKATTAARSVSNAGRHALPSANHCSIGSQSARGIFENPL